MINSQMYLDINSHNNLYWNGRFLGTFLEIP